MAGTDNVKYNNDTEEEIKQKSLTEEIKEMQLFMYAMIHDLKTPLSNLDMIFSLFKKDDLQKRPELMKKAEIVLGNMRNTIDKLNKLMALREGKQDDIKIIDLNILFKELKTSEISSSLEDVEVKVNFSKCPRICYPETYLKTILSNLINNAIKYSSDKRPLQIHMSSRKLGDRILLTVRDNGQGIDIAKEGKNLFQPFKKLSNSKGGSGLGLFLVKELVEKNNGHVIVDSTPDVGTTFTLYLNEYKM